MDKIGVSNPCMGDGMFMKNTAASLKPGDSVAIIAPSGAVDRENLEKGIALMKSVGLKVSVGESVYKRFGYLSAEDKERASDLIKAWTDPEIKAVFAARGGYGAMRILPYFDFEVLKQHKKILVGYSDITALHIAFWMKARIITFHGPMGEEIGRESVLPINKEILSSTLIGRRYPGRIDMPDRSLVVEGKGCVEGDLVGGNLSLVAGTIGTPWELDTKGKILFLEEVDEKPYRIDRMLCQLDLAGKLDDAAGFLTGDFTECEADESSKSFTPGEVLKQFLLRPGKPWLSNVPAGHGRCKVTLPMGARVKVDSSIPEIQVLEPVVS